MYKRKTKGVYIIRGKYLGMPEEDIDTADTFKEARYLKGEYELAFGTDWNLYIEKRREKIECV